MEPLLASFDLEGITRHRGPHLRSLGLVTVGLQMMLFLLGFVVEIASMELKTELHWKVQVGLEEMCSVSVSLLLGCMQAWGQDGVSSE